MTTDFEKVLEDIDNICSHQSPGLTLMSNAQNHKDAELTCRAFNSMFGLCDSLTTETQMRNVFMESRTSVGHRCRVGDSFRYWCGFTDLREEDVWRDVNRNRNISNYRKDEPWFRSEPNGRTFENCAENEVSVTGSIAEWNDAECDDNRRCFFCNFPARPKLTLRGLSKCLARHFDTEYKWTNVSTEGCYEFQGRYGSRIVWAPSPLARHWAISSMFKSKNMNITLTSSFRPNTRYPMGLHRWQVIGDRHDCEYVSLTGPGDVDLHFSACSQDDFSCEDGSCVSIQKRCDRINDCGDSRLRGIQ